MKVTIASLLSAFFALDSLSSTGILAQVVQPVEYTFNRPDPFTNTGTGDPKMPDPRLIGHTFPNTDRDISFLDGGGRDGSTAANFSRSNLGIRVPNSYEINLGPTENRMVSLDFKWDGTKGSSYGIYMRPQVLFEQGGGGRGLNIYLRTRNSYDNAELNMEVWKNTRLSLHTNYDIEADRWYTATLVLDATASTFSGYLDDEEFGSMEIGFLPLSGASDGNGLGGVSGYTWVLISEETRSIYEYASSDCFFKGQMDNFRVRNYYPLTTTPVVEYAFTDDSNRYKNTGDGGSSSPSSLNGIPKPSISHGIAFQGIGAGFSRSGCIQVPTDVNVNGRAGGVGDRTISLSFKWGGSDSNRRQPQILWEEGGRDSGINMYLYPINNRRKAAFLVMAVWEKSSSGLVSEVVQKRTIHADVWYHATMVLDRDHPSSDDGTLTGYLDGVQFGQKEIDFFRIEQHNGDNCLGGMKQNTRFFATDDSGASAGFDGNGFYFKGYIDKFRLINRAEHPVLPTGWPSMPPTNVPTMSPTISPSMSLAPTTDPLMVVEYMFDDSTNRMGNTGDGDPEVSLDGNLIPESDNGISFLEVNIGNGLAIFTGTGCIQVPTCDEINKQFIDRMIMLNFLWDGTVTTDPQILFEEGSGNNGVNIYLRSFVQGTAELVMAVWETNPGSARVSTFVNTTIEADKWYQASLVLDQYKKTSNGLLRGYLNGMQFAQVGIDFFFIRSHYSDNCLGGMKSNTFIVDSADASSTADGFYFHGLIESFRIFNSVQDPGIWAVPPALSPSISPTTDPLMVVEYTFDNSTDHTGNTGDGDPAVSLHGILVPESDNGISFLEGNEGNGVASFTGTGCIQVPTCDEINGVFDDRTIALNFLWDGTSTTDPQILFEEGSSHTGVNIYLQSLSQGTAELVMAVWETHQGVRVSEFVSEMIQAGTWYQGSLVLDRYQRSPNGFLYGFLNGKVFGSKVVDFFFIRQHYSDNCLGGMKSNTFIVGSADVSSPAHGFYFHGQIDNFLLFNSAQYPDSWAM